jgi:hypothetical protein
MLNKLAGRLKWERTDDGIRVVIPVRTPWLLALLGTWFYTLPSFAAEIFGRTRDINHHGSFAQEWIGLCIVVVWFTMIFTAKHVLILNSAEMTIQVRLFGIGMRSRTVATSRFHNLRYTASELGAYVNVNEMSRIQIDRDSKTRNFAFGIKKQEADALIGKMMEVYSFPRDLAFEHLAEP